MEERSDRRIGPSALEKLLKRIKAETSGEQQIEVDDRARREEEDDYSIWTKQETARQDVERRELDNEEKRDNLESRKKYARRIFCLLCVWITLTYATVICSGLEQVPLRLSDTVLVTLITSGTVNIIGMFAVVLNYLFPRK